MSDPYEEMLDGEALLRLPPPPLHERVCARLHRAVAAAVQECPTSQLLSPRSEVQLRPDIRFRPDLALVTRANGKLWLVAEIISSEDHRADTVLKKTVYEDMRIPRLWMADLRYDNLEVYHASPYGLILKGILAGREELTEQLLPSLRLVIEELFHPAG
jgi:Uma2 family endonuclease